MNIRIICIGKLKEKFLLEASVEYIKRLKRYCSLEVIELKEEKIKDRLNEKEINRIKDKEGESISLRIKESSYIIPLDIKGQSLSSEDLALETQRLYTHKGPIDYIVGGSYGLSDKILHRGNLRLSLSKMTFPHQLFRVILLEQIYRSFKIINNEAYHK